MATQKQKKIARLLVANATLDKPLNGGEMLAKVGYSKSMQTAKVNDVLESEGVKEEVKAIADRIPDDLLEKVHLEGLQATKLSGTGGMVIGTDSEGGVSQVGHSNLEVPDYAVRHKYLDSGYKLKGAYAPDRNINMNLNVNSINATDPIILQSLQAIQDKLEHESPPE